MLDKNDYFLQEMYFFCLMPRDHDHGIISILLVVNMNPRGLFYKHSLT